MAKGKKHKRKFKGTRNLKRNAPTREEYDRILIVCEGTKTEPNYFEGARNHFKLSMANVVVSGESGSDPMSVVAFAKKKYTESKSDGDPYDKVYCVFDRDGHTNYASAVGEIESARPDDTWDAITSVPCFEYWLLLHFTYTDRPYKRQQRKGACDQVIDELKKHIPSYKKSGSSMFEDLIDSLGKAKQNADKALKASKRNETDNPSTHVHRLIEFMQGMKDM